MKNKKLFSYFILFIFLIINVYGLGVSGKKTSFNIDFEPGYTTTDEFRVFNKEGYVSTYIIKPEYKYGADLTPYFTITPDRIENVAPGEGSGFTITLELPDELEVAGESRTMVRVDIDATQGGFRAYPAIGLNYYVFVLYPFKYIKWNFNAVNMNLDEARNFTTTVESLGEPIVYKVYSDIEIKNLETNETIRTLRSTSSTINPKQKVTLLAEFDSTGLSPGDYRATPTLYWDINVSTINHEDFNMQQSKIDFRIGRKHVKILNFTRLFEIDAINEMNILIESAWNTNINDIYADVSIQDKDTREELKKFKSLNTDLKPWHGKTMLAYFDTTGFEEKEYIAVVTLNYDGSKTVEEGIIRIGKDINAKVVEEIPGKFKLDFSGFMTTMNLLIFLLIVFILINAFLLVSYFKKKKEDNKEEIIDPDVLDKVLKMRAKYSESYIKGMLLQKGWSEKKINKILKSTRKK